METFLASIRIALATMLICVAGYATGVWALGQAISPDAAQGSMIVQDDGTVIGSSRIAQAFTGAEYFWPRPSAVDYDAAGAGGSNLSPNSTALTERANDTTATHGATAANPLPADLAAASGAGLDPHITERAAVYQASRVAEARGLPVTQVEELVREMAFAPGGFLTPDRIVNVLELNLALDDIDAS